jgi:hypothetical protein
MFGILEDRELLDLTGKEKIMTRRRRGRRSDDDFLCVSGQIILILVTLLSLLLTAVIGEDFKKVAVNSWSC